MSVGASPDVAGRLASDGGNGTAPPQGPARVAYNRYILSGGEHPNANAALPAPVTAAMATKDPPRPDMPPRPDASKTPTPPRPPQS